MDWNDFLPEGVAVSQRAYETDYQVWRMRECNFTYKEIGKRLGFGASRAQQRHMKYLSRYHNRLSPAEAYLSRDDVANVEKLRTMRPVLRNKKPTLALDRLSA